MASPEFLLIETLEVFAPKCSNNEGSQNTRISKERCGKRRFLLWGERKATREASIVLNAGCLERKGGLFVDSP